MKVSELPKTKYGHIKCYNSSTNESIIPKGFKLTHVDCATLRSMKIDCAIAILGFDKSVKNRKIKWYPKLASIVPKEAKLHGLYQLRNRISDKYGSDVADWLIPKE